MKMDQLCKGQLLEIINAMVKEKLYVNQIFKSKLNKKNKIVFIVDLDVRAVLGNVIRL